MDVVILKDGAKESYLKNVNYLNNNKVITLSELKKNYFFDYDERAVKYLYDKYNFIPDISYMYLNNLYYIKDIDNDKIKFLINLKEELDNNNLLIYNPLFKEFINNSNIILYDLDNIDNYYKEIFKKLNVTYINPLNNIDKKDIYEFDNINSEIEFVASTICELIKNNVNINKIKLANVSDKYIYLIDKIFKLFNIPVEIKNNESIIGTLICKEFINNYSSNIKDTLDKCFSKVLNSSDNDIYKKLVNIVNKYSFIDDYNKVKDLIMYDLKHTKKSNIKLTNSVKIINYIDELINDEYIFLFNFNEGSFPNLYKDEDYLTDDIKKILNISTSYELNNLMINYIKNKILSTKNIFITYHTYSNKEEYISSIYDDNFNIKRINTTYNNSNNYNKYKLTIDYDIYNKYKEISDELVLLNNNYDIDYNNYDNKFTGIEHNLDKVNLSYTKIDTYNKCSFKYYIENILKLNKYEDSFKQTIGNIFHEVLSKAFKDNFNLDEEYMNSVNNSTYKFNNKDKFFIEELKSELKYIIDTINNQNKHNNLNNGVYEEKINIDINDKVSLTGIIDKIMYNDNILTIIDYKTGVADIKLDKNKYGLNMQLPIYIYLIKNKYIDYKIGGFYLQKILENYKDETERYNNLKLEGYTNINIDILKEVDDSYNNSVIIKSLKTTNSGTFYAYSKLVSDDDINDIYDDASKVINNVSKDILKSKFDINPKELNGKNISCEFCKYKDLCYMKNKDIVKLGGLDA